MTVSVRGKRMMLRVALAMAISPSVPILALSLVYWKGTGSAAWFSIFFAFGYLFFLLFGIPVVAALLRGRKLLSCVIGGGAVTIAPILLLRALSLSFDITLETLMSYVLLVAAGGLGGAIFWLIAFAGSNKCDDPADDSPPS